MSADLEVVRLYYGQIDGPWGLATIHGYAIKDPKQGVVLVDTGVGGPLGDFRDFPLYHRSIESALADHGLAIADVSAVITTHLHQDHYGHNVIFKHLPFHLQRTELERARKDDAHLAEWFDFTGARFELLEGDAEILDGIKIISTPGHTSGHQSVLVEGVRSELLVGDAAFTVDIWERPDEFGEGENTWAGQIQSGDPEAWRDSLRRLRAVGADRVHLCHDTHIVGFSSSTDTTANDVVRREHLFDPPDSEYWQQSIS